MGQETLTARDLMTTSLMTLRPDMSMTEAIDALLKSNVSGATVVDAERHVVGVLSEKDCLRIFAVGAYTALPHGSVSQYMSTSVTTIGPELDLFSVADLFLKHAFRRLPVIEDGVLIGQVSRRDVLGKSRQLWEGTPRKAWTESKYIPDEVRAKLDAR